MKNKEPFLFKIANELIHSVPTKKWNDITIVLPNKRAGIFLKKYIAQLITEPVLLPDIIGMEDFVLEVSKLQKADDVFLLSQLFEIYKKLYVKDNFEEFLPLGQVFLSDFNEIDRYLINPDDIYKNIVEYKAFDVWEFDHTDMSEIQKNYLAFWENLPKLYHQYSEILTKQKLAYQGLLYRYVCDNPSTLKHVEKSEVWFCGFNALTRSEETIIQLLQHENKAKVFWDVDSFYIKDYDQEAGLFIRKHLDKLNKNDEPKWISSNLQTQKKIFNEIECSGNILQTKALSKYLTSENTPNNDNTVIVLADEKLLIPVLSSLPENIKNVNVTMGFPLKETPLTSFILKYIRLFYHVLASIENHEFYFKDFFDIINEPFFTDLLKKKFNLTVSQLENLFIQNQIVYFTLSELKELLQSELKTEDIQEFIQLFDLELLSIEQLLNNIKNIIYLKRAVLKEDNILEKIELETIFEWNRLIIQLQKTIKANAYIQSVKSLLFVLKQLLPQYKIDFYGEPLSGIQIMGMLETRNLDFSEVLMLSVNEGILPMSRITQTFIPYEVKKYFDLPTVYEKDAIFAYHFYRLLQYPEKIALFYNNEKDDLGANGEKSRFIHQILNDLPNFQHQKYIYHAETETLKNQNKKIIITPEIREQILAYLTSDKGISPSALNKFINCPLDFYFTYILGIREEESIEETIEANVMGSIIHNVLEELYKQNKGKVLTEADIKLYKNQLPKLIQEQFKLKYKNANYYKYGQNKIIYELTQTLIKNLLEQENNSLKSNEIKIIALEERFKLPHTINIKNKELTINLTGIIDRIDTENGDTRIIDYKTGSNKISDEYKFQLKLYTLMYYLRYNQLPQKTGIIFLIDKHPKFTEVNKNNSINTETIDLIKNEITDVIDQMLNLDYYEHNTKAKYCLMCEN
jgi:RecB family exonuclease